MEKNSVKERIEWAFQETEEAIRKRPDREAEEISWLWSELVRLSPSGVDEFRARIKLLTSLGDDVK